MNGNWTLVNYLKIEEIYDYISTLPDEEQMYELERSGKHMSIELLKNDMKLSDNFYDFIKQYSPKDFKIIQKKQYVSQRVIQTHVELWNETHNTRLKKLRIFFM